jgi:pimeloyl-ACP methyl ester carboxylesterase
MNTKNHFHHRGTETQRRRIPFSLCASVPLWLILCLSVRAGNLLVDVHSFTSANIVNRRVTLTLLDPGPVSAGPWLIAGDSVAQFTDTNGTTIFTNVLAGGYRLDIAGTPSRSFPFGMPDTNTVPNGVTTNVVGLIGATNTMPWFYTAAQLDAILATNYATAAGTNVVVTINGHTYTVSLAQPIVFQSGTGIGDGVLSNRAGMTVVDWQNGLLESNGVTSVDIQNRSLNDAMGTVAFNWATHLFGVPITFAGASNVSSGPIFGNGSPGFVGTLLGPASSATNVTGSFSGDVTGTQSAMVINPGVTNGSAIRGMVTNISASLATNVTQSLGVPGPYDQAMTFSELWTNTKSWTVVHEVVSNGFLYSDGSGANPSEATFNMPLGSADTARLHTTINIPSLLSQSADFVIGVWTGATNTTASGLVGLSGIGVRFGYGSTNVIAEFPALVTVSTNLPIGTYNVEVNVDSNTISFVLYGPGHTNEFSTTNSRAGIGTINGFGIWNTDTRVNFGGASVGPLCIRKSLVNVPNAPAETNDFVVESIVNNDPCRIWIPPNYDATYGAWLIVPRHGNGYSHDSPMNGPGGFGAINNNGPNYFYQTLVNAGYIVASGDDAGNDWGNQGGVTATYNLIEWVKNHYNVRGVFLFGESMGSLGCLNFINQYQDVVSGYVGLFPVTGLVNMTNGFWTFITNAFGIGNYSTATTGFDPETLINGVNSPDRYRNVPMRFYCSPSDNTVLQASNTWYFVTNVVQGYVPEATIVECTGAHGDASHYQTNDVLSTLARWTSTISSNRIYPTLGAGTNRFNGGATFAGSVTVLGQLIWNQTTNTPANTNNAKTWFALTNKNGNLFYVPGFQ